MIGQETSSHPGLPAFIPEYSDLRNKVEALKEAGHKVVLTQGVYDLIHEGHAIYLEKAKSYGDILIVGVDSDELTKKRKGPLRPIVPETERLRMLMHLRHVDIVTLRHISHDPGDLIRLVRPDVLIVSESTKDFTATMATEYEGICQEIVCLPPQALTSTSARIRLLTIEGAMKMAEQIKGAVDEFMNKIKNVE